MKSVYMHEEIGNVQRLHQDLLTEFPGEWTVLEFLDRQARTLLERHRLGDPAVCLQLQHWLPRCVGKPQKEVLETPLTLEDARLALAREHGFSDWRAVQAEGERRFDPVFEAAVNAVVEGEIKLLRRLLEQNPGLTRAVSPCGHRATLLHYIAANGVETWRQKTPSNAAEITQLLIDSGADPAAKMRVYGGEYDTLALLLSSAHPAAAGQTEAIEAVLRNASGPG